MLYKSQIMTQASGSVGGTTFAHNKSGLYQRARSIPVNPNTPAQNRARAALTTAVQAWNSLTEMQRGSWDLYAANVSVTNKLGDATFLSGQNWFVARFSLVSQILTLGVSTTLAQQSLAPSIFNRGTQGTPSPFVVTLEANEPVVSIGYETAAPWNVELGGLALFVGNPQNISRSYYRGPYQFLGYIDGETSETSPLDFNTNNCARPFTAQAFQRVFFQSVALLPDGRVTSRLTFSAITS